MLADLVDHVIGIDPDKDWITAAIIEAGTTRVVDTARFATNRTGYLQAIDWADGHSFAGERAWAIEGSASFGRGLTVALSKADEWVIEFDWARKHTVVVVDQDDLGRRSNPLRSWAGRSRRRRYPRAETVEESWPSCPQPAGPGSGARVRRPAAFAQVDRAFPRTAVVPHCVPVMTGISLGLLRSREPIGKLTR